MALYGHKSLRQFECNDALWNTFRRMAEDQEKSVDDLVNDAMESYAQLAGYQTGINEAQEASESPATPPPAVTAEREIPAMAAAGHGGGGMLFQGPAPPAAPPMPSASRFGRGIPSPAGGLSAMFASAPNASVSAVGAIGDSAAGIPAPPLYLVFDNQKYRIDKDQFIIGRGAKSSDLPIKDGNISRKHAAVIRRNGTYFIKDLGSTNGIDYKGMRIDNKRIDEGDVFHLCDYELRFTFKR